MSKFQRRARPPMAWSVNQGAANSWVGNGTRAIAAATLTQTLLLYLATAESALGVPAVGGITVLRIVGDLTVAANDAVNQCWWSAGIVMTDDITGDAVNLLDPSLIADADAKWLWFRHGHLPALLNASILTSNVRDAPMGGHIDVTVKRKMRPGQSLNLMYIASAATLITPNIRCLVSRPA